MLVLITRPEPDAGGLVAALAARGLECRVEPMLIIEPLAEAEVDLAGVQALVFTSANGVRAFAGIEPRRDLPVFAVGDTSAAAARDAGFAEVRSAAGDVEDLAKLVVAALEPRGGTILHPAAREVAGDLKGALEKAGFTFSRSVVYRAEPARALSPGTLEAFRQGRVGAVTFFSPRSARSFVSLAEAADIAGACAASEAICLSRAVAREVEALSWRAVRVAERPNQDALIACFDAIGDEARAADESFSEGDGAMTEPGADEPQDKQESEAAAQRVIAAFGGIRPMATKLGVAVSTIQGWKERATIPANRHAEIRAAAERHGVDLDETLLKDSAAPPAEEVVAEPVAVSPFTAATESPAPEAGEREEIPDESPATKAGETSAEPPDAKPADTRFAWAGGFVIGALVFALGVGGAVLTRPYWSPSPEMPSSAGGVDAAVVADLAARLDALESAPEAPAFDPRALEELRERVAALDARLAGLAEGAGASDPVLAAELADLRDRLAALASASGDLAAGLAAADQALGDLRGSNAALAARLAAAEGALAEVAGLRESLASLSETTRAGGAELTGDAALLLALLQLRDALRGSAPYAVEFRAVEALAADNPDLGGLVAPLAAHAQDGLATLADLQAAFPAMAGAVVAAERGAESEGWLAGVWRRLSETISIRPVGMVEGDSPSAVVARAEVKLTAGDLAGALAELDALQGTPAEAAAGWRDRAEARVAAMRALGALGEGIAGRLAPAGG
jgi:uroporphyrinogen-III synthase